jgi:hypothetical protein
MKVGKERIKEEIIKNKNFFMKILYKIKKSDKIVVCNANDFI